jgi:hypothetical protein
MSVHCGVSTVTVDFYATAGAMTGLPDDPGLGLGDLPSDHDGLRRVVQGLRAQGTPARVRCGFSNYFDPSKWYDHWITERWDGSRWVRDDPQVDELQAEAVQLGFDPYDQPAGEFLSGAEAWQAARAGEVDPELFGIFDMWGLNFIAGNLILDFACVNKVELLPWDGWGMMTGPHEPVTDEAAAVLDDIAALLVSDDVAAIRARYEGDDRLRVPADITSFIDGRLVPVHLDL